jgi:hypothetical protein
MSTRKGSERAGAYESPRRPRAAGLHVREHVLHREWRPGAYAPTEGAAA